MSFFWWAVIILAALAALWYAFGRPAEGERAEREGVQAGPRRPGRDTEFADMGELPPPVHAADNRDADPRIPDGETPAPRGDKGPIRDGEEVRGSSPDATR